MSRRLPSPLSGAPRFRNPSCCGSVVVTRSDHRAPGRLDAWTLGRLDAFVAGLPVKLSQIGLLVRLPMRG